MRKGMSVELAIINSIVNQLVVEKELRVKLK